MVSGDRLPENLKDNYELVEVYSLPFPDFPKLEIRRDIRINRFCGHIYNYGMVGEWSKTLAEVRGSASNGLLSILMARRRELIKKLSELDSQIPDVSPANMASGDWMEKYRQLQLTDSNKISGGNK